MEIELPDGTVLEAPDDADVKTVVRNYHRQIGIAQLKKSKPSEYDPESGEFKRRYSAAEQEKTPLGIADPKTGRDLAWLPVDQRDRFFKESAKDVDIVDNNLRQLHTYTPEEQKKFWEKIDKSATPKFNASNELSGLASGGIRAYKGLTNLLLPDSMTPGWASDENIRNMDERDAALPTDAKVVGGTVATLPLSGGVGALQKGATALSIGSKAPALLTKALASAPTRAALEGSLQGGIYADPNEQGRGALEGAAFGTVLNRTGALGGRLLRGAVQKSNAANAVEQVVGQHGDDIFIPLSQAADSKGDATTRLVKTLYKEGLPFLPGTQGRLEGQVERAQNKLRESALKEALPPGGTLIPNAGEHVEDAVTNIDDQFKQAYADTIKKYAFNVPKDLKQQLGDKIRNSSGKFSKVNDKTVDELSTKADDLFQKFSNGTGVIDGENLIKLKEEMSVAMRGMSRHEKAAFLSVDSHIDDMVKSELSAGNVPQNLADLAKYEELTPAWRAFVPVQKAAKAASDKEGQFLFRTLAKRAGNSPEQRVIGRLGRATVDQPVTKASFLGRALTGAAIGGTALKLAVPKLALAAWGAGQGLSTEGAQKALMGSTKWQKYLADAIRKNPKAAARLGSAARAAAVIGEQEN